MIYLEDPAELGSGRLVHKRINHRQHPTWNISALELKPAARSGPVGVLIKRCHPAEDH